MDCEEESQQYGSIELHGCHVGFWHPGRDLLSGMAQASGVPATAGLLLQYGSYMANRFEGPTSTFCPNGLKLKEWSHKVFSQCQW